MIFVYLVRLYWAAKHPASCARTSSIHEHRKKLMKNLCLYSAHMHVISSRHCSGERDGAMGSHRKNQTQNGRREDAEKLLVRKLKYWIITTYETTIKHSHKATRHRKTLKQSKYFQKAINFTAEKTKHDTKNFPRWNKRFQWATVNPKS